MPLFLLSKATSEQIHDFRDRGLTYGPFNIERSGGILPWQIFKTEMSGNKISSILLPSQPFNMSHLKKKKKKENKNLKLHPSKSAPVLVWFHTNKWTATIKYVQYSMTAGKNTWMSKEKA